MTSVKSTCTNEDDNSQQKYSQEKCREQMLFLLELYVRHVHSSRLAKLNEMFYVPTTVAFRFLDFKTVGHSPATF